MKRFAFLSMIALAGLASAQPVNPPTPTPAAPKPSLTPQPRIAVVDAEVLLIGCAPMKVMCGIFMNRQEMAIKITKVDSGPLKVGDAQVLDIVTCFEGPLLRRQDPKNPNEGFVELDQTKLRRGSKIHLEMEVYPSGNLATTDKITVTKL